MRLVQRVNPLIEPASSALACTESPLSRLGRVSGPLQQPLGQACGSAFVWERQPGCDPAEGPRSPAGPGGESGPSCPAVLLTSNFLLREQYKMLLGRKCQAS